MAFEASFTITKEEFPLSAVFSEFPASEIELDRVVPTNKAIIPYFWVREADVEDISMKKIEHPGINDIRVVDEVGGEAFIRIDWDFEYESVLTAILETYVNLISAVGTEDQWTFELRADTHQALSDFQSYCRDNDIPIELTRLHSISPLESGREYDLTDAQRMALNIAYDFGYYDSPRHASQEDIAEQLGISPQAVASRLRRGTRRLITSTLVRDNE